ncbi:hypothetical protein [Lactobacillus gasseri]|jgi:hypothetical protein|uniref:Helix-turn-helix domain-containing protein n=2 Tax=Lactobacillus gasseri TaxID=1596 RepID=D1YLG8_LACGS|nr:hypothetical protein [Lactobacillus gasseri]EFB62072.1 hypothetical protein HMPREF9209_2010 [Lactobacillus gasseri 224-1]MCZ3947455.1 DNA-binding protein [Lactobacillus gasseri]QTH65772.1 DNA-binding protein [Lactobacillus gasseri]RGL18079.1 DNA-binding protein [Lactobacillus gasseri]
MPNTEYFNFKQAMRYLGIQSYTGLKDLINAGLPISIVGKSKKIKKTDIDKFMKVHTVVTTTGKNKHEENL